FVDKPKVVEDCEAKPSEETPKELRKNTDAPIIKEWVSNDEEEEVTQPKIEKKIVKPSISKIEFVKPKQPKKNARKNIKKVEYYRQNTHKPRGNQRNWNNMMSQKLGTHSTIKRSIHKKTTLNDSNVNQRVNTIKSKTVNTARPKAVVNAVRGNVVNAVKASACWVWESKIKVIDYVSKYNSSSIILKKFDYDKGVTDSRFSRHMTGNMSYLIDYEKIDEGYVSFRGNPNGEKSLAKEL
nr:hypothetical protein [Tanacetum cinerariifolium]